MTRLRKLVTKPLLQTMLTLSVMTLPIAAQAAEGGSNVGGGGNAAGEPVDKIEVIKAIESAYHLLIGHFKYMTFNRTGHVYDAVLFDQPTTILEAAYGVRLKYEIDGPCKDANGDDKDGAADVAHQSVCLSIARLQSKLGTDNLKRQVGGLLAHELSHLVGANESQARALQADVVSVMDDIERDPTRVADAACHPKPKQPPCPLTVSPYVNYNAGITFGARIILGSDGATRESDYRSGFTWLVPHAESLAPYLETGHFFRVMDNKELPYFKQQLAALKVLSKAAFSPTNVTRAREIARYFLGFDPGKTVGDFMPNALPWGPQYRVLSRWTDAVGQWEPTSTSCTGFAAGHEPVLTTLVLIHVSYLPNTLEPYSLDLSYSANDTRFGAYGATWFAGAYERGASLVLQHRNGPLPYESTRSMPEGYGTQLEIQRVDPTHLILRQEWRKFINAPDISYFGEKKQACEIALHRVS